MDNKGLLDVLDAFEQCKKVEGVSEVYVEKAKIWALDVYTSRVCGDTRIKENKPWLAVPDFPELYAVCVLDCVAPYYQSAAKPAKQAIRHIMASLQGSEFRMFFPIINGGEGDLMVMLPDSSLVPFKYGRE